VCIKFFLGFGGIPFLFFHSNNSEYFVTNIRNKIISNQPIACSQEKEFRQTLILSGRCDYVLENARFSRTFIFYFCSQTHYTLYATHYEPCEFYNVLEIRNYSILRAIE
jgi:hypothetical protein